MKKRILLLRQQKSNFLRQMLLILLSDKEAIESVVEANADATEMFEAMK